MSEKILKDILKEQIKTNKLLATLVKQTNPEASTDDVAKQLREALDDRPKAPYQDLGAELMG